MAFLELQETSVSQDKIGSDPKPRDQLDLGSGTIDEFNKHAPGMWLFRRNLEYCCIYRVPDSMRCVNPKEYTPQLLIVGPLHHSLKFKALNSHIDITNTKLMGYLNMEQHKKFYLAEFARRFKGEQTIDGLRRIIEEDEEIIRESYSESTAWIESPHFVDMILHDSVFVLEFILRSLCEEQEKTGDPLMDDPCLKSTVTEDLLLLENQLPYFILEKLFDPIVTTFIPHQTFRNLVITHFLCEPNISCSSRFRHFTDLIRLANVEKLPDHPRGEYDHIKHMYTAHKLYRGGVKFEPEEDDFSLHVSFENGCLKLPCLWADDKVERKIRNVMALEQCHYPYKAYHCDYFFFLDHLIDTHKDVELLVEKGIIMNWIGQDRSVVNMVNELGLGTFHAGSYYSEVAAKVNDYYKNPINRSQALLKQVYFGDLWTGTATVGATFLLVMTFIQAVTSIIQTIKK